MIPFDYGSAAQRPRDEREKGLPDYILYTLDAARAGYDRITGRKLSPEETEAVLRQYLPPA